MKIQQIQLMKKIYICGPMRHIKYFNLPAFFKAERDLEGFGWHVVNPARIDLDAGFDPMTLPEDFDWAHVPGGVDLKEIIRRDLDALQTCDAIYMLSGWKGSRGAIAEVAVADWMGLEKRYSSYMKL